MLSPCFLAVEMTDLRSAKTCAPSRVRNVPEIFIRTFIHAQVLFGLVVGEGDCEVGDEPQDIIAVVT